MAEKQNTPVAEDKNDADAPSSHRSQSHEKKSRLTSFFPFLRSRNNSTLREDLHEALSEEGDDNTVFSPEERTMLNNILRLREARVDDVMIPRSEIEAIELNMPLAQVLALFEQSGHSRLPVYAESLDDPRGMIHIRDVLNYITRTARAARGRKKLDLTPVDLNKTMAELNLIRTVLFVPGSMPAAQLLTRMQTTRTQMALVIDEYGGTDGLASMEDIVELVVGDIEDEHDNDDIMIVKEPDESWLVDARAELDDLEEAIGGTFTVDEHGEDVDTVGGLIVSVLDRIPGRGEIVEAVAGYRFRILEADKRRIKRVRISKIIEDPDIADDNTASHE